MYMHTYLNVYYLHMKYTYLLHAYIHTVRSCLYADPMMPRKHTYARMALQMHKDMCRHAYALASAHTQTYGYTECLWALTHHLITCIHVHMYTHIHSKYMYGVTVL